MKIKNAIYYTPYQKLEAEGISFSDYSKGKSYYTQLAPLFDAMNPHRSRTALEADFLIAIAKQYTQRDQCSFLDIACGTGRHVKELVRKGYQVVGIDGSKELIKIARKTVPDAVFNQADMRSFHLDTPVDCAYSVWDSYVYLSRPEDMRAFARQCSAHIKRGGILVLDSKNYLKQPPDAPIARRVTNVDNLRIDTLIRRESYLDDKVYEAIFTSIIQDTDTGEANVIVDQTLARIYSVSDLEKSLQGFRLVNCYGDFDGSSEFNSKESKRLITVFQKI